MEKAQSINKIVIFFMKLFFVCLIELICLHQVWAQWLRQNSGTTVRLNDVVMLDSMTAFAVGDNGKILKTTNGGMTWSAMPSGTTRLLNAIDFYTKENGFVVGNGVVCHTTDAGATWMASEIPGNFISVAYGAAYIPVVYAGTDSGIVRISEDGGLGWTDMKFSGGSVVSLAVGYGALQDYYAYVATQDFIYHKKSGIVPTLAWDSLRIERIIWDYLTGGDLQHFTQYLVGETGDFVLQPLVLRRVATDTTWTRLVNLPPGISLQDAKTFFDTSVVYVCGSSGKIFKSTNAGDDWSEQNSGTHLNLNAISFIDVDSGIAVGDSGIIVSTIHGGPAGIEQDPPPAIPLRHSLDQNYPNPFNPTTTIQYAIPRYEHVSLKVYNILGEEISTLDDGYKLPGHYEVQWTGENTPSGVYFYGLITPSFIESKSMQLIH